ncbi:MAG: hypothetical protein JWM76_1425 [Pseudonocardiales bacterium]|nr:hypothetical protein [Pseudonocardiales bacterium]
MENRKPDSDGLEALPYKVMRIEAGVHGRPDLVSHGTGFAYAFEFDGRAIPCLVSNKHVLSNRPTLGFAVGEQLPDGRRAFAPPTIVRFTDIPVIDHPDDDTDLAIVPLLRIYQAMTASGRTPFTLQLSERNRLPGDRVDSLPAATGVLMVGFPNGLMDAANNLPIVRRGTLALPYRADYQGRPDCVVDIAAFPGSSGSPVFAYFDGHEDFGDGDIAMGGRSFYLIGILHSGPQIDREGKIVQKPVPTESVSVTPMMINLGYCAKASLLDDFIPLLRRMVA